jgi:peptidoglycan/xylan/chitin deacetylase (PgdA/CDA1 family)
LAAGLDRLFGRRVGNALGILMYHRISPMVRGVPRPTFNVRPEQFRRQLAGLLALGYRPWPLRAMLELARQGGPFPPRAMVVTFDDGYECVYTHAFPILQELGVPATVFLATAWLDHDEPFTFDEWMAAGSPGVPPDSWRPLTTGQASEMLESGLVELGTHTHRHLDYRGLPDPFAQDLQASLASLHEHFGLTDAALAFPFGCFDSQMSSAARQAGILGALTTVNHLVRPGHSPFAWGRFTVFDNDTPEMIAAAISGRYESVRRLCKLGRSAPSPEAPSSVIQSPIPNP